MLMPHAKLIRSLMLVIFCVVIGASSARGAASFDWEKGLRAAIGEAELRVGALAHADVVRFDKDTTELDDAEDFRRARLTGRLDYRDIRIKADHDFGISQGWKSLFAEYRGVKRQRLRAGNHTTPFSMEDNESSSNLAFMERSIASALAPGLLSGLSVRRWGSDWMLAGGIFGDEFEDLPRRQAPGQGLIGRATWTPARGKNSILHVGLALERRNIDSGEAVRLRVRPFSRLADARLVDTRSIRDAEHLTTQGYEIAWASRNRRLQGEWYRSRISASSSDPRFSGYYLAASMTFGANDYRYARSRGVFGRVKPKSDRGALELGLRYSVLDLNDDGIDGGEQIERSLGATWVYSRQLRVMANYSRIEANPNRDGIDEDIDALGLRLVLRL